MQDVHMKLNPGLPWQKAAFNKKTLHQQIGLKSKEETSKMPHMEHSFVWCWDLQDFEKMIRNTLKVLKCSAGEEWRWVGQIEWKMNTQTVKQERNILHTIKYRKGITELVTSCTGTALWNMLLKVRQKGQGGRRCKLLLDDWMTLRKRKGTRNWKMTH